MNNRYQKRYIIPALLLLTTWLLRLLRDVTFYGGLEYLFTYGSVFIIISLYCLLFQNRKVLDKVFYFVGFGWLFLLEMYYDLLPALSSAFGGSFSVYEVANIFFVFACSFMIVMKIKPHLAFAITGGVLFSISHFIWISSGSLNLINTEPQFILQLVSVYGALFLQDIAYILILFFELGKGKKAPVKLEEQLTLLKDRYDNMEISAVEYEEKRAAILNEL